MASTNAQYTHYTNDHIHRLFTHYFSNHKKVKVFVPLAPSALFDSLTAFSKKRVSKIANDKPVKSKVMIPIFANNNHWTLLYIHYLADTTKPPQIAYIDPKGSTAIEKIMTQIAKLFPKSEVTFSKGKHQYNDDDCGPMIVEAAKCLLKSDDLLYDHSDVQIARKSHLQVLRPSSENRFEPRTFYLFLGDMLTKLVLTENSTDPFAHFGISRDEAVKKLLLSLNEPKNLEQLAGEIEEKGSKDIISKALERARNEQKQLVEQIGKKLNPDTFLSYFKDNPTERIQHQELIRAFITLNIEIMNIGKGNTTKRVCEHYLLSQDYTPGKASLSLLAKVMSKNLHIWKRDSVVEIALDHKPPPRKGENIHLLVESDGYLQLHSEPIERPSYRDLLPDSVQKTLSEYERLSATHPKSKKVEQRLTSISSYLIEIAYEKYSAGDQAYNDDRDDDSLNAYYAAYTIYEVVYGDKHPDTAKTLDNIGRSQRGKYKYKIALEFSLKALAIFKKVDPKMHSSMLVSLGNIASIYKDQFKYKKALTIYSQVLKSERILWPRRF